MWFPFFARNGGHVKLGLKALKNSSVGVGAEDCISKLGVMVGIEDKVYTSLDIALHLYVDS